MSIPMTDLKAQYEGIKNEIDPALNSVIHETNFILGAPVNMLEDSVARYCGVKFASGVASGTDALVLSLAALGIGKNDEVIATPFTFIATAEAISRVGARPVFCDIDYSTYNIDPKKIEKLITKNTKAVIPVHLYGMPCAMDEILSIAKTHKLKIIEDCAQSFGSEHSGKKVGSIGDCGCLSFFPAKTLGCYGDGGMIITNNEELDKKIKMLRNHGSTAKYHYGMHGFNSRLDTLQAAILKVKLAYIDQWIEMRIENAKHYNQSLSGLPDLITPAIEDKHTFNYYTIRLKRKRQDVQNKLKEKGISSAIYYPLSLHLQEIYQELGYKKGAFPVTEEAQDQVLSLPMYPELKKNQIEEISAVIKKTII